MDRALLSFLDQSKKLACEAEDRAFHDSLQMVFLQLFYRQDLFLPP